MLSNKLIVSHRGSLIGKYGPEGLAAIEHTVANLVVADAARGIRSHYVYLDDPDAMKRYQSKTVSKTPSAPSCKRVIDKICGMLSPDYIVLLGSYDVIPEFRVPNPTLSEDGDTDADR